MKLIHGRVVDALWSTNYVDIDVPPADAAPLWGLHTLDLHLGAPERGQMVLITGNGGAGTTSLARSIALANAQRGLRVSFYATDHDAAQETKHLVSAAIGTDVASAEPVGAEPEHGIFAPISYLSGCIRVFNGRPSVLPHEVMEYIPDILICDEIDSYLGIHEESINRGIILEKLRDFARRNNCVVIAVSRNDDDFDTDYAYMAEPWEFHVATHLDIHRDDYADPEDKPEGQIEVYVVRHAGRWARASLYLADQRKIGRLGDIDDDLAEGELRGILDRDHPASEEGRPPKIHDEVFQTAISSQLRKNIAAEPAQFLRKFGLAAAFNLQSERLDKLAIRVDRTDWARFPTLDPTLDLGDGVEWTFTTSVEADVTVAGQRLSVTTELYGEVVAWMTGRGMVLNVDVDGLFVPWSQQV